MAGSGIIYGKHCLVSLFLNMRTNVVLTSVTAVSAGLAAIAAYLQVKESRKMIKFSNIPLLKFRPRPGGWYLSNIGRGVALDIKISIEGDVFFGTEENQSRKREIEFLLPFYEPSPDVVVSGRESIIWSAPFRRDRTSENKSGHVVVECKDVDGTKRKSSFEVFSPKSGEFTVRFLKSS